MSLAVRPVDFDSEQAELLDILGTNLPDLPHACRFRWLYLDNPAGPAWSWFVYEKNTDTIVGIASLFPRLMWVGETVHRCGQVGDFAVSLGYRSLGPALMLQRATFEPVTRGELAFCYDCPPHDQGLSTFRRLGIPENCRMHRYTRLLRIDRQLPQWCKQGRSKSVLASLGNRLLSLRLSSLHAGGKFDITLHEGRFSEEFSELDQRCTGEGIRSRRTVDLLNWRYRDDPLQEHQVLVARCQGELVGCAVYVLALEDVHLVDLWGVSLSSVGLQLLEAVNNQAQQRSAHTVQALVADRPEEAKLLQRAGFWRREDAAHIVAYTQPNSAIKTLLESAPQWSFNYGNVAV